MTPQVPDSLRELPQWVLWKYEVRVDPPGKTKVPYQIPDRKGNSYKADSTQPRTWTVFDSSIHYFEEADGFWDGIGFVFSKDDPYFGMDLDKCLTPEGTVKPWAQPILERFADSYAEISPSGNGIKIWARGKMPGGGTAFPYGDGRLEVYDCDRFFTVTGRHWGGQFLDIEDHQNDLEWVLSLSPHGEHKVPFNVGAKFPHGTQHDTLVSIAGTMRARGVTVEAIDAALQVINRDQCEIPGPPENISRIARSSGRWKAEKTKVNGHAQAYANGNAADHISDTEVITTEEEIPWEERVTVARQLVKEILDGGQSHKLYGSRENPAPYMVALAGLKDLEQKAARRLLKEKFKSDFIAKEWDAQLVHEKAKLQKQDQQKTPYILNNDGGLRVVVANAITMMSALPIAWNSFSCRAFLTEPSVWKSKGNWTDYDDIKAAEWCQHQGLHIPPAVAMDACNAIARSKTPHYSPVAEYLRSIVWDKNPRLNKWLRDYLGAIDDPYTNAIGPKWLISAVKRVMEPGCQADYTLVLEGSQGKKKSTALRALTGKDWFSDDISDIGSKDSAMQLQGKWIVELSELDAFRRAEITTIKAWLVRREDHFRPPYGRRAEDFPRQNVFAASTNKDDWGLDDTGLRRFWPVKCGVFGSIDIDGITSARDQLWAEAYHRYLNNEEIWLSNSEIEKEATAEQHDRQEADPWAVIIEPWLETPTQRGFRLGETPPLQSKDGVIHLSEILWNCLSIPEKDWNRAHKDRVSRILRLSGYTTKRTSRKEANGGKRPEFWVKT